MADPLRESDRLSIVCIIHSLDGGGAERVMAGLASRLSSRGHQLSLVTFYDGVSDRHSVNKGVKRVRLNLSSDANGLLARIRQIRSRHRAIHDTIAELSPDVVLSFCDRTNMDVLLSSTEFSPPIVVSERSDPARQSLGFTRNLLRKRVYRRAACVVALTETSADYLRTFSGHVSVIPSAIGPPPFSSDRSTASDAKTIVGAGRLESEKGFDRLLNAFAQSTADHPTWRLVIYGDGSQRENLLRQADKLGILDRFQLPGWVQPLAEDLSKATLFCLSSRYEGFPSVLLEAMSMGVPSLSVDCESGPRAIILHGRNGFLVESSVRGMADGISRMITHVKEREAMATVGKKVVQEFGWKSMVDRYEDVLRDAVTASGHERPTSGSH